MSTSKTSPKHQPATYSPPGCNHPVMTHLAKKESEQLRALAAKDMRSLSATARMLIIEGMERRNSVTE